MDIFFGVGGAIGFVAIISLEMYVGYKLLIEGGKE